MEKMWRRCGVDVEKMWKRCREDLECGEDVEEMWIRRGRDVDKMWKRCGEDVDHLLTGQSAVEGRRPMDQAVKKSWIGN